MGAGDGARRDVKRSRWIAFPVPHTNVVILATVSKGRLSGMIYDPLINRPLDPWKHDCHHCQKDTSTTWPLKARKALRMLRLATVSRGTWEMELAPNYTFRGRRGKGGWIGTVDCYNGTRLTIRQDPANPMAKIAHAKDNLTADMAARNLKLILMARIPPASEIAACLPSLEAANQATRKPPPCRQVRWPKLQDGT